MNYKGSYLLTCLGVEVCKIFIGEELGEQSDLYFLMSGVMLEVRFYQSML